MISSLENNNIGNALSNELPDNISIQKVGESGNKNFREEIINKLAMQVPSISARLYLFNNSNLIHFNVLKVLRNKAQLKTNISYLNDFIANESLTNTTYFLPLLPPINFTEIATGYLNTDKIETNIFYTQNLKKLYIKNSTKIKLDFTKQNEQVITSLPVV